MELRGKFGVRPLIAPGGYGHLGSARAQLIYEYAENASHEPNTSGR